MHHDAHLFNCFRDYHQKAQIHFNQLSSRAKEIQQDLRFERFQDDIANKQRELNVLFATGISPSLFSNHAFNNHAQSNIYTPGANSLVNNNPWGFNNGNANNPNANNTNTNNPNANNTNTNNPNANNTNANNNPHLIKQAIKHIQNLINTRQLPRKYCLNNAHCDKLYEWLEVPPNQLFRIRSVISALCQEEIDNFSFIQFLLDNGIISYPDSDHHSTSGTIQPDHVNAPLGLNDHLNASFGSIDLDHFGNNNHQFSSPNFHLNESPPQIIQRPSGDKEEYGTNTQKQLFQECLPMWALRPAPTQKHLALSQNQSYIIFVKLNNETHPYFFK